MGRQGLEIALAGDVMLGRGASTELLRMHPSQLWGDVLPHLLRADWSLINLECAITGRQRCRPRPNYCYFHADPAAVEYLKAARIDCCCLANEHSLDFGMGGLADTIALLDQAGIGHVGAGANLKQARSPAVFQRRHVGIGAIAFTDYEPACAATKDQPGTLFSEAAAEPETLLSLSERIGEAKSKGADVVVVSVHWSPGATQGPPPGLRLFAHALVELGADVIHGHSGHLVRGLEVYKGKPIFYGTGDFIDDCAVDGGRIGDESFLFLLRFEEGSLVQVRLLPLILEYAGVRVAREVERESILDGMKTLSREFGTELLARGDSLYWKQ